MKKQILCTSAIFLFLLLISFSIFLFPAKATPPKVQLQYIFFPVSVFVDTVDLDAGFCFVNHGESGQLIYDSPANSDEVSISIPVGMGDNRLILDSSELSWTTSANWSCTIDSSGVDPQTGEGELLLIFRPNGTQSITAGDTICFDISGLDINSEEGLALLHVDQQFDSARAEKEKNGSIGVFKADDISGIVELDPHFSTSAASGIQSTDITNWDIAYNWGDHSTAGYITPVEETDPTVNALAKATLSCTNDQAAKWNGSEWVCANSGDGHSLDAADGSPVDVVYVDNLGKVGIGITSPTERLEVDGMVKAADGLAAGGTTHYKDGWIRVFNNAPNDLRFRVGGPAGGGELGTEIMRLTETGNLGIGTTNPVYELDVFGDINFTGNIYQDGSLFIPDFGTMTATAGNILVGDGADFESVTTSGDVTIASTGVMTIAVNAVEESMLKAVNSATDEDILTYEDEIGDFEWHTPAELGFVTAEIDPTLTNDGAVTIGSGSDDPITLTFNADAGIDGTITWDGANDQFEIMNANVGIGTTSPDEKLEVNGKTKTSQLQVGTSTTAGYVLTADASGNATWQAASGAFENSNGVVRNTGDNAFDNFVFGSPQLDHDGNGNHYKRFFFDKSNGAFRAGIVTGTYWDTDSLGSHSFATGYNTKATGLAAMAIGFHTTASGNTSTAIGYQNIASGDYSIAMGASTTANGYTSTAMGNQSTASGEYSFAAGLFATASGDKSSAIGYGVTASSYRETVLGSCNAGDTPNSTTSWDSEDPLFVIGNGASFSQPSNAMVVLKNGNTGIATTSPVEKLDVRGNINLGYQNFLKFNNYASTCSYAGISFYQNEIEKVRMTNMYDRFFRIQVDGLGLGCEGLPAFEIRTDTGNVVIERTLTVNGSGNSSIAGNVGIGTTSPGAKLEIRHSTSQPMLRIIGDFTPTGSTSYGTIISFGDTEDSIRTQIGHYDNTMYEGGAGTDLFINTDGAISLNAGHAFVGYGSDMYIDNGGNIGIGTTSPSYKLHVNGTAYATGAAGALSDRRSKTNINDLSFDALEVVNALRPVTFEWKEPLDSGMEGTQLGFIAQEVEGLLPEAVLTQDNEEQTKGLKYNALIPLLTKAIQELEAQNNALKAENNSLRYEIEQIKDAIGL